MDTTEFAVDAEFGCCCQNCFVDFWGWVDVLVCATALNEGIGTVAVGEFGKGYIHHIEA